jgi:hypothetical protein
VEGGRKKVRPVVREGKRGQGTGGAQGKKEMLKDNGGKRKWEKSR